MKSELLTKEIRAQILTDILSYDWLLKIVSETCPGLNASDQIEALIGSIKTLVAEDAIVVGPASTVDSKVHIDAWSHDPDETALRVREFVSKHGNPPNDLEAAFGFWIGLPIEK